MEMETQQLIWNLETCGFEPQIGAELFRPKALSRGYFSFTKTGTMEDKPEPGILTRIFGRDPLKVPCFRTTFLYSISSYFGVGLLTFLFTSRPQFASHVGMGSFVLITLGYFPYCRYQYTNDRIDGEKLQQYLQQAVALEGTEESENTPKLQDA